MEIQSVKRSNPFNRLDLWIEDNGRTMIYTTRFLPFIRVQCSIALAGVNRLGEKLSPKNEMNIEKAR